MAKAEAVGPKLPAVLEFDVGFLDGSNVKVVVLEPAVAITTKYGKLTVPLSELRSGGPPPDGIPHIDDPTFMPVAGVDFLADNEPVMAVDVGGDARAYPVQIPSGTRSSTTPLAAFR